MITSMSECDVLTINLVAREVTSSKEEMVTGMCPLASPPFDNTTIVI